MPENMWIVISTIHISEDPAGYALIASKSCIPICAPKKSPRLPSRGLGYLLPVPLTFNHILRVCRFAPEVVFHGSEALRVTLCKSLWCVSTDFIFGYLDCVPVDPSTCCFFLHAFPPLVCPATSHGRASRYISTWLFYPCIGSTSLSGNGSSSCRSFTDDS